MKALKKNFGLISSPSQHSRFEVNSDINEATLSVVPLHQHPEYMKQCCDLINEEWKRSETARMLSLKTSCDKMPTCLILLNVDNVIGHCKLTPIPSIKDSCFVESVVISKSLRGKGLGSFLMKATEQYCKAALSLKTIHLSTLGQELFYERLGYKVCEPVNIYGGPPQIQSKTPHITFNSAASKNMNSFVNAPIPPPMQIDTQNSILPVKSRKTYMVKSI